MRYTGRITNWNEEKGFGFIAPPAAGAGMDAPKTRPPDIFVHIKAFADRRRRPTVGDVVTYELATDARQRPRAENVQMVGSGQFASPGAASARLSPPVIAAFVVAAVFLSGLAVAVALRRVPPVALLLYAGMSVVTFGVYASDKSAAQNGAWRVSENALHLLAVLGGWPGALCAQQVLRHKSRKASFLGVFWFTVAVNVGGAVYLLAFAK